MRPVIPSNNRAHSTSFPVFAAAAVNLPMNISIEILRPFLLPSGNLQVYLYEIGLLEVYTDAFHLSSSFTQNSLWFYGLSLTAFCWSDMCAIPLYYVSSPGSVRQERTGEAMPAEPAPPPLSFIAEPRHETRPFPFRIAASAWKTPPWECGQSASA